MGTLLKNGQVLYQGNLIKQDILVENGKIVHKATDIPVGEHQVVDCQGKVVLPGFVDMHVHLREPGFEHKETIATGTMAAAKGGFTTIACMPNTKPVLDSVPQIEFIHQQTREEGYVRVLPIAAITVRQLGDELTDFASLQQAGIVGLSDDGVGVQSSGTMKAAMQQAVRLGLPVIAHCEDNTLINNGCVHDGVFAEQHGLRGIPSECESIHVGRDILLAEATGVHYHVCHISTKESVRLVREAKKLGIKVTTEVTPHHLLLCDEDIPSPDANYKMNPPLRSKEDRDALIEGLLDGTIDFIATDHAPHAEEEKAKGMQLAPFGIVGLETAFPLLYTHFVLTGKITLQDLVDKLSRVPAECFQLASGTLNIGVAADLTVVDLEEEQVIDRMALASKGKNTPFHGWKCQGWPVMTMVNGSIVYQRKSFQKPEW